MRIEIELLIAREHDGVRYEDIPVAVYVDYTPACAQTRFAPQDDAPDCSVVAAFVSRDICGTHGVIVFPMGFPVCLTAREDDEVFEKVSQEVGA